VFLINVPIAVLGAACALPLIPESKNPAARPPDLVGAVMSIAGLGLVLWALIEAPVRGWSSPRVIGAGAGTLAPYHVPHAVLQMILGSLGGALGVAARVGGPLGAELGRLARSAFVSGMDLGLATGACVALAGCLIALIALPSRAPRDEDAD